MKDKKKTRSKRVHSLSHPLGGEVVTHELLLDCATFFDVGRGRLLELRDHDAFVLDFGSARRGVLAFLSPRRFLCLFLLLVVVLLALGINVLVLVVLLLRVAVLLASFMILETAHLVVVVVVIVISRREVIFLLVLVAFSSKDGSPAPLFAVILCIEDGFSLFPELAGPVFCDSGTPRWVRFRQPAGGQETNKRGKKGAPYVDIVLVCGVVVVVIEGSPVGVGRVRFFWVVVWSWALSVHCTCEEVDCKDLP